MPSLGQLLLGAEAAPGTVLRGIRGVDSNHAEPIDDAPCILMAEVMPSVADAFVNARNDLANFPAFTVSTLLFR